MLPVCSENIALYDYIISHEKRYQAFHTKSNKKLGKGLGTWLAVLKAGCAHGLAVLKASCAHGLAVLKAGCAQGWLCSRLAVLKAGCAQG